MYKIDRFLLTFLLLTFVLMHSLYGEDVQEEMVEDHYQIEKENWAVGISQLQGMNLDERHLYLLSSLPQLLKEELNHLTEHTLSEEDIQSLKQDFLQDKFVQSGEAIDELHQKRDSLLFSQKTEEEQAEQYDQLSEEILEEIRTLQSWREFDYDAIEVAESLPLEYIDNDLFPPDNQIPHFLKKKSLDMLIIGQVDRVDDAFFLELSCFGKEDGTSLATWSGAGQEEELNSLISRAAKEMRTILLGRSWAELVVSVDPADSLIKLDGETIGVGTITLQTAIPGFRTLSISNSGYIPQTQQIYLPAMEQTEFSLSLEEGDGNSLFLLSTPPGANVYYGSQWMGYTPLVLPEPDFPNDIKISLEGYKTFHIPSEELRGDNVTVLFDEEDYDKQLAFDGAKHRFYRSLGWASISMGIPLVLYGIYQNQSNLYYEDPSQGNYDAANRTYYGFLGGVALSSGLLINTFFRLSQYIKAAEESTEE